MQTLDELAQALGSLNVGAVASLMAVLPKDVFAEPGLRHHINATPHNRASAHALALENLFLALRTRSDEQPDPVRLKATFDQGAAVCRLLMGEAAPVVVGHSFKQVPNDDTYATFLFLQQRWPESLAEELGELFDEYVAAGLISVDRAFCVNHTAYPRALPLEVAIQQGNHHAVRALFRHTCSTEKLGEVQYKRQVELVLYIRREVQRRSDSLPQVEQGVANMVRSMMQGRLEATGRIHYERIITRQRRRACV